MSINYEHRLGSFEVPRSTVARDAFKLLPIFARCVVVKCEFDYAMDAFRYEALSPDFDAIAMGKTAPRYAWIVDNDRRGEVVGVRAVREVPI